MAATLLTTGLLCVMAAIGGGGIEAFGGKIPIIQSPKRQTALGLFGIVLLLGAYLSSSLKVAPKDGSPSNSDRSAAPEHVQPEAAQNSPASAQVVAAPLANQSDNALDGTVWRGVFVGPVPKRFEREMNISFTRSGALIAYYQGVFWATHNNCTWSSPRTGSIRIDCYPETVKGEGFWPNRSFKVPLSGVRPDADVELPRETTFLTISDSTMSGTRTTEEDDTSLKFDVTLRRLPMSDF